MSGPLTGYRIIELAGLGPAPFAAMMLSDMGAEVIRVERPGEVSAELPAAAHYDIMQRNRRSVAIDLKHPDGVAALLSLVEGADVLLEGFRPGVMERLGLGPEECASRNERLIYGRMTGWGQSGPYANAPGHDINYIAMAGALAHFGRRGEGPVPPLNLVGDFGGGGMFLAYGVVCALLERHSSGRGQVVDAAMVDGAAALMAMFWAHRSIGEFDESARGTNILDSGAHFYDVYRTSDGKYLSIGAVEPQFYAELLRATGLDGDPEFEDQNDRTRWPRLSERLSEVIASRPLHEWDEVLAAGNACYAPVLTMSEAAEHPHHVARGMIVEVGGVQQPAPAPRFSRTAPAISGPPPHPGEHTRAVLLDWGLDPGRVDALFDAGAIAQPGPRAR
ncbi:CaiB/BaiF CoA transferase family protein [Nocardia harenae]|uniref:CaiB/BaiF CoA transferase family protein n=1 Tax=Nocardia harenae TaxID=358707 RepID=UPI0008325DB9|nr:CaiB/BaiF CoA-transferase family protein [Nocardia harenae]